MNAIPIKTILLVRKVLDYSPCQNLIVPMAQSVKITARRSQIYVGRYNSHQGVTGVTLPHLTLRSWG